MNIKPERVRIFPPKRKSRRPTQHLTTALNNKKFHHRGCFIHAGWELKIYVKNVKTKSVPSHPNKISNPTEASFTLKSSIQIERKHKQKAFFGSRVTSHTKFQSNAHDRRVRIFVSMNERQWARGVQLTNMCFTIALLQNVREGESTGLVCDGMDEGLTCILWCVCLYILRILK